MSDRRKIEVGDNLFMLLLLAGVFVGLPLLAGVLVEIFGGAR